MLLLLYLLYLSATPLAVQLFHLPRYSLTLMHCGYSRSGHDLSDAAEQAVQHAPHSVTAEQHASFC